MCAPFGMPSTDLMVTLPGPFSSKDKVGFGKNSTYHGCLCNITYCNMDYIYESNMIIILYIFSVYI